jgi:hypothetical protein
MLAIGAAAGAASFTHAHNVAAGHGQPGWLAWADAIVLELMSIASGLELRRRRREHTSVGFPAVVLGCAVVLSLAAQVVEAEPSPIGWTAAAIPALGFLVMVKVALGHAGGPSDPTPSTLDDTAVRALPGDHPAEQTAVRGEADSGQRSAPVRGRSRGPSAELDDLRTVLPTARAIRDQLAASGDPLTRGALAHHRRNHRLELQGLRAAEDAQVRAGAATDAAIPRRRPGPPPTSPRQRPERGADVNPLKEGGDTS